ncbi:MAG: methionine adenosyltransferase [Vampirovibrionales bacterium]|nr:methionine adenosyltransferase [Vampirovibrionales bacterium]
MSTSRFLFTSESVSEGHPDKVCDQISDAILDAFLSQDPNARVACETTATTGMVLICGEITSSAYVDIPGVARKMIEQIGYVGPHGGGFDAKTCAVLTSIDEQSPDIAGGVNDAHETRGQQGDDLDKTGAGDQGIMFGYACDETPDFMPMPIDVAHGLVRKLADVRKSGQMGYLRPDSKSQVTIEYVDGRPYRVDTIVISAQHDPEIDGETDNAKIQARIAADVRRYVIDPVFAPLSVKPDAQTKYFINPSGRFVVGGPQGDAGLTGRKIIVDTYGGYSRHGGGAFSGKDPTKVDRSAAYAARHVAKNIVAAGLASKCELQVSYAIGVARPVSVNVNTFGTGVVSDDDLAAIVMTRFDLRPEAIIRQFDLRGLPGKRGGAFYQHLAAYGHMGRTDLQDVPWERLDHVAALKEAASGKKSETGRQPAASGVS